MELPPDVARERFAASPVARLATIRPGGAPHLVPVVFALEGELVYSAVDAKPKASGALSRLRNVSAHPAVSLLVDHYEADWRRLWWVRADGTARVVQAGPERDRAIELLRRKYAAYRQGDPWFGVAVVIEIGRWVGWQASLPGDEPPDRR